MPSARPSSPPASPGTFFHVCAKNTPNLRNTTTKWDNNTSEYGKGQGGIRLSPMASDCMPTVSIRSLRRQPSVENPDEKPPRRPFKSMNRRQCGVAAANLPSSDDRNGIRLCFESNVRNKYEQHSSTFSPGLLGPAPGLLIYARASAAAPISSAFLCPVLALGLFPGLLIHARAPASTPISSAFLYPVLAAALGSG